MTDLNKSEIIVVLDRSGSMSSMHNIAPIAPQVGTPVTPPSK